MPANRLIRAGLDVDSGLVRFVEAELLPGLDMDPERFWNGLAGMARDLTPWHRRVLKVRAAMQDRIDNWHKANPHPVAAAYRAFLREVGYLVPQGASFQIDTADVDPEVASVCAPQLVVPADKARFVLNAVNARWGSLGDALYYSNAVGPRPEGGAARDPAHASAVLEHVQGALDQAAPLRRGRHGDVARYGIVGGRLEPALRYPEQLVGWRGPVSAPEALLLRCNGLHIEVQLDPDQGLGALNPAGISDVIVEAAVTTIVDLEDSVACVDAQDKVKAYRVWLHLMQGDLTAPVELDGQTTTRRICEDREYDSAFGALKLRGRSLVMLRHVGHLMTTDAVRDADGAEIPEGLLDAIVTSAAALHDLRGARANSAFGSIYVVKPKLHGPDEVDLTVKIFDRVEDILGLARNTIKLGLMDEERRTSATLFECLRTARHRIAFINTGFLDRTGDEIRSSGEAGPMVPVSDMAHATWLSAYEERNVQIGLRAGLVGRAQIGKGMWTRTDDMAAMIAQKRAHPQAGASVAWVPSPTAAVLHALHYHQVDVRKRQDEISKSSPRGLDALLTPPLLGAKRLSRDEIAHELARAAQSILGYVVRWVDHGIGCSKVPDLDDTALMEDRATCRVSAQLLANWLHHGMINEDTLRQCFAKTAQVVDAQNASLPGYRPMAPGCDGHAYRAALDLVLKGMAQPSGSTEPILYAARRAVKAETRL